ncbi:sensor histidine kinase [Brachybacterium sp. EE-P12]|uniref:histidine kinase n=1 Tax=Candidatus Brachybacterium intestinipullorum TaxID=2838512 RepID=A0A9D2PXC1_9MICO|nr:histidine kinase [Brachybacterium sp. EE-P12]HJC68431.1 sensor histidine kinase [Candidatus Brachybacterium intestinipullorum]
MHETSEQTASPARSRISPAALASVVVGGVLSVSWGVVSILMLVTGLSALPALGSGLLLLIPWLLLMQGAVRIEQRRAVAVHGIGVNLPARRRSHRTGAAGWLQDRWFELGAGAFWRGVLHHHLAMLTAGAFLLVALALLWLGWSGWELALLRGPVGIGGLELSRWSLAGIGTVALVLCAVVLALGALADRGLARGLISGSEDELREQVAELAERRQGAVDAAAQERLRIERDLHDGVQPRLVNLAMTLGLARTAIRSDPDRAEALVGEAHAEAKAVMTDLRQLARGIHPAVLADRGLDAALSALAARSRIPVVLDVTLLGPGHAGLDREREGVAYFVVAEALTNIAKHAEAEQVAVTVRQEPGTLRVRIEDDGRGGALVRRDGLSTGLAGLTDRVRAAGGVLEILSPRGGGTVLEAVLPLPTSSPPPRPSAQPSVRSETRDQTLEVPR